MGGHFGAVVADDVLHHGGGDARVFHHARGSVPQGVEGKFARVAPGGAALLVSFFRLVDSVLPLTVASLAAREWSGALGSSPAGSFSR